MLQDSDDITAHIGNRAQFPSAEDDEMRQRVLEYLEQSAQFMEEIADELTRLSKQTRDKKRG